MITSRLAPNPGPMTLDGTRTWIIGDGGPALVVDPGPADQSHLDAILAACPGGVAEIWLTHHHHDHIDLVPDLVAATGAPVRAIRADLCRDADPLVDGELARVAGTNLQVVALPGHTADSAGFLVEDALLSGDTVLGRGTTVIAEPDGSLTDYLASLDRLAELTEAGVRRLLPAHGEDVDDAGAKVREYRNHRQERLEQVRRAVAAGASTPAEVVAAVYTDIPDEVRRAAESSVRAQLAHLAAESA